ncbi:hypothetical protein N7492_003155 [Penicillium capsulatum]|uniref:Kinesin-like protein n=1 Tax=Penicillium capsulatum TaxID=69766 RepID=A0A9W9IK22_9EURO|nr:hypothetical protein N7492_003155 [Penicillium capsulatum]KAJ6122255.1 hypothetical protein N7512_004720 [Penicillium capsulatum]
MEDENMIQPRASTRSRIPQAGLREMTSATTNSRSGILPPGSIANKATSVSRTNCALPIPAPRDPLTSIPATRPKATNQQEVKRPGSISRPSAGAPNLHTRGNSYSSSTMSRMGSTTTRSTNPSLSSSISYGNRPASSISRPQSSIGSRRPNGTSISRPATSLDTHAEDAGTILGKRKGMEQLSFSFSHISCPPGSFQKPPANGVMDRVSRPPSTPGFEDQSLGLSQCISRMRVDDSRETSSSRGSGASDPNPLIPWRSQSLSVTPSFSPSKVTRIPSMPPRKTPRRPPVPLFLSKESSVTTFDNKLGAEWDQESREKAIDEFFTSFVARVNQQGQESFGLKETVEVYKSRIAELEKSRDGLNETNITLRVETEGLKNQLNAAEDALKEARRDHEIALGDLERRQRVEMESIQQSSRQDHDVLHQRHQDEIQDLKRKFASEIEDHKAAKVRELGQLTSQSALETQRSTIELQSKERELASLRNEVEGMKAEVDRERKMVHDLRQNLDMASANSVTLESTIRALKARIEFLEGGREEQSQAFERCNQEMMDALVETEATKEKLRREETLRRKLHNQVQELKGNIRVFCRVRPSLHSEPASELTDMQYPDQFDDAKEINILGPEEKSSLGNVSRKNNNFSFDRVFNPSTQNAEVFDEISQLVQSALDGYNVCIFCYGQTGSGKTYTMSSQDGMIPRAVHQIYQTAQGLEEKGWRYTMAGNFVEVYNENLNDLLGNPDELDKKKHEIRHDMQRGKTIITDINTVQLDSPEMVETILQNAAANRSVAATKANERSSRSHSVFILKLTGENHITGERSEGTLNLVDLAGSERLSHSGATGERLKETQNINRSLSSLGDVIAALGQGKDGGHIPYRNSKVCFLLGSLQAFLALTLDQLTYLLQFSLGGNSKTLMFVMVSPLQAHMSETLTSLKFATKVHNTHIGTAKRQARVRDS